LKNGRVTFVETQGALPEKNKSFKKQAFKTHLGLEKAFVSEADIPSNFKKNTAAFAFIIRLVGDNNQVG